jgi:hypothetical protein
MSQIPQPGVEGKYVPVPERENALLNFVRQPRILLIMLAGWSLLAFLTQLFTNSALFAEQNGGGEVQLDGILAGLSMNWEALPLALLYIYCARDPERYRAVFWLALVALGASIASSLYHWLVIDTLSIGSVFVPLVVSGGLAVLVFLHLFAPREESPQAASP